MTGVSSLSTLERLCAEATPGPWKAEPSLYTETQAWVSCDGGQRLLTIDSDPDLGFGDRDAAFIAAADPVTVAALVELAQAVLDADDPSDPAITDERCDCAKCVRLLAAQAPFAAGREVTP